MYSQSQIFLLFFIIGIIISLFFDFFKVLRKSFKTSDFITILEDILYLFVVGIFITFCIFKLNNGELRLFIFLAIFSGIIVYSLTISNFCVIILYTFMNILIKILSFPFFVLKNTFALFKKKEKS